MEIIELKNKHLGQPAFCLGTAPHLNNLDLHLLTDFVTIGCNQLTLHANEYNLNYICFQRNERFASMRDKLAGCTRTQFIIPRNILRQYSDWNIPVELAERICSANIRFTSPGHADFFSFDLENCLYAGDSAAIEIQLAVWMGCNPIYLVGVDAEFTDPHQMFYDDFVDDKPDLEKIKKYDFPDLRGWIKKVRTLLWSRGTKLYNAAGEFSSLDALPKIRLEAAVGRPAIAVTSKSFSEDEYLVHELKRYFRNPIINNNKKSLKGNNLVNFLRDADGVILGTESLSAEIMEQLPCLRFVSKFGVGLNNIDFDAAKRHQIEIKYRKGVNSDSVAELTIALALMLLRRIDDSISAFRVDKWTKLPGKELAEITLGIIGNGHVGKVVTQKVAALGVGRLLTNDLLDFPEQPPAEFVPIDYLLSESDIVTLHVSMEKRNYHMVNEAFIEKMKAGSMLINTSRGEIIDEDALFNALKSGKLSGAALDVYEHEPNINKKLMSCPALLTTCHIAGSSNRAIKNMGWAAIEGLLDLFNKEPV